MEVSELLFNKDCTTDFLFSLESETYKQLKDELPNFSISRGQFNENKNVISLLSEHTSILNSKSEARRAIQGNAIGINKRKITDVDADLLETDLIHDKYIIVDNGKKNKFLIEIQ